MTLGTIGIKICVRLLSRGALIARSDQVFHRVVCHAWALATPGLIRVSLHADHETTGHARTPKLKHGAERVTQSGSLRERRMKMNVHESFQ